MKILSLTKLFWSICWRIIPLPQRRVISLAIDNFHERAARKIPKSEVVDFKITSTTNFEKIQYSLVATCYNESTNIEDWLNSILEQSHLPQEVVVCDGGSSDSTVAKIENWKKEHLKANSPFELVFIKSKKRINIAEGRNLAARAVKSQLIAFSDVGCVLDKHWARNITTPFSAIADLEVSMGWYIVSAHSPFSHAVVNYLVPKLERLDLPIFLPSARSLAMRVDVFNKVGGYPEDLKLAGEDSLFDYHLKQKATRFAFVSQAIVRWRFPQSFKNIVRTIYRYAYGDGESGFMFWDQYYQLLIAIVNILGDLYFAILFFSSARVFQIGLFNLCGVIASVSVVLQAARFILPYKPMTQAIKDSLLNIFAVTVMVTAQVSGFVMGVIRFIKKEKMRREN